MACRSRGCEARPYKIPESVLVVIHTPALRGAADRARRPAAASGRASPARRTRSTSRCVDDRVREVAEETGIASAAPAVPLARAARLAAVERLRDLPASGAHRYAPGVTHNTEHVFGLVRAARRRRSRSSRASTLRHRVAAVARGGRPCFSPSNAEAILQLPRFAAHACDALDRASDAAPEHVLRVATYNIHKGVRGIGPAQAAGDPQPGPRHRGARRRHGVPAGSAHAATARGAPLRPHLVRLARACRRPTSSRPRATTSAYRTNAITRHGEHGNALLSRWPMRRHRPPRRLATTASSSAACCTCRCTGTARTVHAIVAHFGLIHGEPGAPGRSAWRASSTREVPRDEPLIVAGDFNDWGERLDAPMRAHRPAARRLRTGAAPRALHVSVARAGVRARPHLHARLSLRVDRRCRAARPGRACPTTCRWWPNSRPTDDGRSTRRHRCIRAAR